MATPVAEDLKDSFKVWFEVIDDVLWHAYQLRLKVQRGERVLQALRMIDQGLVSVDSVGMDRLLICGTKLLKDFELDYGFENYEYEFLTRFVEQRLLRWMLGRQERSRRCSLESSTLKPTASTPPASTTSSASTEWKKPKCGDTLTARLPGEPLYRTRPSLGSEPTISC